MHYRDWGNASAPPLIILHGYTGHAGKWIWKFDAGNLIEWMQSTENTEQEQWEILQEIASPTLIAKAGSRPFTDISVMIQMDETIPSSELVIVPESGHDIHIEQFEVLLNTLNKFLEVE